MRNFIFLDDADTLRPMIVLSVNGNHMRMTVAEAIKLRQEMDWAIESIAKIQKSIIKEAYK